MTDTRVHLTKVRPGDVLEDRDGLRWDVRLKGADMILKNVTGRSAPLRTDEAGFLVGLTRPPLENADV